MSTSFIKASDKAKKSFLAKQSLTIPLIPFIQGNRIGVDIISVMHKADAAGKKATRINGPNVLLPEETVATCKEYAVAIKGQLTTPVGGGIRSLSVALRQEMDLFQSVRPVRYFKGISYPRKDPLKTDMVIFRDSSKDI